LGPRTALLPQHDPLKLVEAAHVRWRAFVATTDKKKPGIKPGEVEVRRKSKPSRGNGRHGSAGRKKAMPREISHG
jgi:hypothetical protein